MQSAIYCPDAAVVGGKMLDHPGLLVDPDGLIQRLDSVEALAVEFPEAMRVNLKGEILLPGTVNGHNHGFQVLMRGMGEDQDFMAWRSRVLYPVSSTLTPQEIYDSARLAYWDMLRHGITAVADFFYLNDQGSDNALAIARAARDVGMQLLLARTFYDWDGAPVRYRESPSQARDHTLELALRIKAEGLSEWATVHVAPHSPHGASQAMVEAAVAVQQELNTHLHIHVAEGKYERTTMLTRHQKTPIQWCRDLGALGPRTLAIHAVWADPDDLAILAESGSAVVHNPASNMILGDGIAPIIEMIQRKIPVLLGTDGGCTNDRHSIFDEMRTAALLQKVRMTDVSVIDADTVFAMGTSVASRALGLNSGNLLPKERFDAVTVRRDDPSLLPGPATTGHIVYAMGETAINSVYVAGERVIHEGQPVRFDPAPLINWARRWQNR